MTAAVGARLGIDLGGTKIEAIVLNADGEVIARQRVATPRDDYSATLDTLAGLVETVEREAGQSKMPIGIGIPGSISPVSGHVQNANSTWLNGRPLHHDLAATAGRPVRVANDANCFALSEAVDGAAAGSPSVFGAILGTGCGGGIVLGGRLLDGPRGIGGEWGHNPLPWASTEEHPGPACWCGRRGCLETWVSGPALVADYRRHGGVASNGEAVVAAAEAGDAAARDTLDRHADRLARGLAQVVNLLDPAVIVLGGGLSRLQHLYQRLPVLIAPHLFCDHPGVDVRPPRWGDASGARGAARLWE